MKRKKRVGKRNERGNVRKRRKRVGKRNEIENVEKRKKHDGKLKKPNIINFSKDSTMTKLRGHLGEQLKRRRKRN